MSEQPFTNRELEAKFEFMGDKLSDILRTVETGFIASHTRHDTANGRLKRNEIYIAYAIGGLCIISLIAVPLLVWAMSTLVNISDTIDKRVEYSLNGYEFELVE